MVSLKEQIQINYTVFLMVQRGILSQSKIWWDIADNISTDSSGIILFNDLKKKYGELVPIKIGNSEVILVTNIRNVKFILDESPSLFEVGKFKYNMFKSFMKFNVGVSNGEIWIKRRLYNECVLKTGYPHLNINYFHKFISDKLNKMIPKKHNDFVNISKKLVANIVFGEDTISDNIFKIFDDANSINVILFGETTIDQTYLISLKTAIIKSLKKNDKSLISFSKKCPKYKSDNHFFTELYHQVSHWIFPMHGIFSMHVIRMLALIASSNGLQEKLRYDKSLIRKCILEGFRLNNAVITTFRTLNKDTIIKNKMFKKGSQFLILNAPFLRSNKFINPNSFNPHRWTTQLEESYYSIMFNKGPQECPGKNLTIDLLTKYIQKYLELVDYKLQVEPMIDVNNVPQMINHYRFNFM
jgi:hypothetical protein